MIQVKDTYTTVIRPRKLPAVLRIPDERRCDYVDGGKRAKCVVAYRYKYLCSCKDHGWQYVCAKHLRKVHKASYFVEELNKTAPKSGWLKAASRRSA